MTSLASVQQPACVKFTGTLHIQDQSSLFKQKDKDLLSSTVTDRSAPKSYFFLSDEKKKSIEMLQVDGVFHLEGNQMF